MFPNFILKPFSSDGIGNIKLIMSDGVMVVCVPVLKNVL